MTGNHDEILIVNGSETEKSSLLRILTEPNYVCRIASSTDEASVLLHNHRIGLIIIISAAEDSEEEQFLGETAGSFPDIAIILALKEPYTENPARCLESGVYGCIGIPFIESEVLMLVTRAMERRKLVLEIGEYRRHLEDKVVEQSGRLRASIINTIRALVFALEAKDEYTSGHSQRVADISSAIARELHLPSDSIDKVVLAALVHDIGKIGIKEAILNKPHMLTPEEQAQIQKHPEIGERIMGPVAEDEEILTFIKHHHSCFDGSGYPDGLKGYQIPLGARILAVADAYEAMTSERPYRQSMNDDEACAELIKCKDKQFDPEVVEAFLRCKDRI